MFDRLKSLLGRNNYAHQLYHKTVPKEPPSFGTASSFPRYQGLERYTLVDKLGDGAFSNVYKALDHETQQMVAVKVIRKLELSPSQRANVLKEVQLMRSIEHPSIVKLLHFIETKEHYFLLLEYCKGGELFHQIVQLTYFSEDLSRHCIRQVAEGIRYLHEEKGIVHRDIKPENLLFEPIPYINRNPTPSPQTDNDENNENETKADEGEFVPGLGGGGIGRVKIADFGLSKVVWDQLTMTPCGTVGYTAPEIVNDERYSRSVDMWALGCVLYTFLCGFPPFYDDNDELLTKKVARGQYTFLSPWWDSISDGAKDLISHLLCIDPDKRYTIQQFLQHPWITMTSDIPFSMPDKARSASETESNICIEGDDDDDDATTATVATLSSAMSAGTEDEARPEPDSMATSACTTIRLNSRELTKQCDPDHRPFTLDPAFIKKSFNVSYAIQRLAEENHPKKDGLASIGSLALNMSDYHYNLGDHDRIRGHLQRAAAATTNAQPVDAFCLRFDHAGTIGWHSLQLQDVRFNKSSLFELNLDHATLIARRRSSVALPATSSPLR